MQRGWARGLLVLVVLAAGPDGPIAAIDGEDGSAAPTIPVRAASEPDYPPYAVVTEGGRAGGFSVELLRAALATMGREVTFEVGPWAEIMQELADGRVQVLPLAGRTPEREAIFDFTFPYLTMHGAIVVRAGTTDIRGTANLRGKRVAVMKGDNAEEYLRRVDLGALIVPLPSFEVALRQLSEGRHDAVLVQRLVAWQLIEAARITNLTVLSPPLTDFAQSFCFAVREGDHALLATLNEGLANVIADGTFRRLSTKWFSAIEAAGRSRSRIVVGGDRDYPPYEFLDANGQPTGFNVDLTRAVARQMDLQVEVRLGPWGEVRKGLEAGTIDAVAGMFYSAERDETVDFSPPHTVVQHTIVVRKGAPVPADLASLAGRSILVMAGDVMEDLAIRQGLAANLVPVSAQEEALRLLAAGKHDCALVARVPALYWIERFRWSNLEVSDQAVLSAEYCFAVPHGNDGLLSRLTEGLAAVKTTGEYRSIQTRWLAPYEAPARDLRTLARYGAAGLLSLLALLVGSVLWSRSLRRQVVARTRELTVEIAERQRTEDALRESEAKYRLVVENATEAIFIAQDGMVRFPNRAAVTVVGYPEDVLTSRPLPEFIHPDDRAMVLDRHRKRLEGEDAPNGYPFRVITQDGSVKWLEVRAALVRWNGRPATLNLLTDVNERMQAQEALQRKEEELRQAQKMEAVGQLAGGIAHDFNNLLQAMLSQTQYLGSQPGDPEKVAALARELESEVKRGASLTRQLLLFSRRETVKSEDLDLNEVVRDGTRMLTRLLRANIALTVELIDAALPVTADRGQLQQVLTNLTVNASDAMPDGGTLTIRTGADGDRVWLRVEDSGHGIPDAIRDRIFEPFFTTKEAARGSGIGLSVVHGIVTHHGGRVEVESTAGAGTIFTVYLPRAGSHGLPEAAELAPGLAASGPATGERILIVEDEDGAREGLRDILTLLGYDVVAVGSGEEAGLLPAEPPFDLLITDLLLPGVSGNDLAPGLKDRWPRLAVILMSGYTEDEAVKRGVSGGNARFLQKPFSMEALAREVRAALDEAAT